MLPKEAQADRTYSSPVTFRSLPESLLGGDYPSGLATDRHGHLYFVTEFGNGVWRRAPDGTATKLTSFTVLPNGTRQTLELNTPGGVAVGADGSVYVTSAQGVFRIAPDGRTTSLAQPGHWSPGVAVDGRGVVTYIELNAIRRIAADGTVTTFAGSISGFGNVDGHGTNARFTGPRDLAAADDGTVYVVDGGNRSVRKITPDGVVSTVFARLAEPAGIAVDDFGTVFVTDSASPLPSYRIVSITRDGNVTELTGRGTYSDPIWGGLVEEIAVDGRGTIYLSDGWWGGMQASDAPPVIDQPLVSRRVVPGAAATLSVAASGVGTLVYAWSKDGVVVDGATGPTLEIADVRAGDLGQYSVRVTNAVGSITSNAATLMFADVSSGALANLSVRGALGSGDQTLIAGFVIESVPRQVLVRGIGPRLRSLGVPAASPDPRIAVYDGAGRLVAGNDDWSLADPAVTAALVDAALLSGAFQLEAGSRDAALLATLQPGAYTVHATSGDGSGGVVLIEAYSLP